MNYYAILLSILLGLIPEAIFVSLFVIGAKKIKSRYNFHFCVANIFIFSIIGLMLSYNIWYYICIPFLIYCVMKLLFEDTEFIDLFLLTIPFLLFAIIGYPCYYIQQVLPFRLPPNLTALVVNRILLIIILSALYPKLHVWYNSYKTIWNRRKGNKIKSITTRNISIMLCNAVIILAYTMLLLLNK